MNLSNILLVTKTFTLRVLGYKNKITVVTKTQREIGLQKHIERKKNNPVTKTGLQKVSRAPQSRASDFTEVGIATGTW